MPTPTRPEKRRRVALPPAATLTDDLLFSEVLSRLPVASLLRVKSVCRSWRAAVQDPAFVRRHLELSRATKPSLLVVPVAEGPAADASDPKDVISFHRLVLEAGTADVAPVFEKALPDGTTTTNAIVPTHCDGLVALATGQQVFVCNPATPEFVALPPGTRDVRGSSRAPPAALAYDTWRDVYVVARYFYREYTVSKPSGVLTYDIGHEIFTLGSSSSSWAWAATADPPHAIGPASPVCTREAVYWCTAERYGPNALLQFGLRDRAFRVAPCPPGTSFACGGYSVVAEPDGGQLCYVDANWKAEAYDVWVAADDDGPRLQWALHCRVGFDLFGRPGVGGEALLPVAVAAAGEEMILAADYKQVYCYDARRGRVKEVVDLEEEMDATPYFMLYHVVPYVESLVSISGGSCRS